MTEPTITPPVCPECEGRGTTRPMDPELPPCPKCQGSGCLTIHLDLPHPMHSQCTEDCPIPLDFSKKVEGYLNVPLAPGMDAYVKAMDAQFLGATMHPETGDLRIKVEYDGHLQTEVRLDKAAFQNGPRGTVFIGFKADPSNPPTLSDWFEVLGKNGVIKPEQFDHLPPGVYQALLDAKRIPLPKGSKGAPGVRGMFLENMTKGIHPSLLAALAGGSRGWPANENDEAGENGTEVTCLWREAT